MNLLSRSGYDLGFQHVLENGLAILEERPFEAGRKAQILESLIEIFQEADRGATIVSQNCLLFSESDRPSFEQFSLFHRYLGNENGDVPTSIAKAFSALLELKAGQLNDQAGRTAITRIIRSLLNALYTERALTPPEAPKEYHFS